MEHLSALLRYIFPPQDERIALTPANNGLISSLPWLPFTLAAFLSRKRGTELIRTAMIPFVPFIALRAAYGYRHTEPELVWYDWISGEFSRHASRRVHCSVFMVYNRHAQYLFNCANN